MTNQMQALLTALIDSVSVSAEKERDIRDYIREDEWLIAIDVLADALDQDEQSLSGEPRRLFEQIVRRMNIDPVEYEFLFASD